MRLCSFFTNQLPAGTKSDDHAHPFWEFVYVRGAGGYIDAEGKRTPYAVETILIHPPGQMHISYSESHALHYCLGVDGRELKGLPFCTLPASGRLSNAFLSLAGELTDRAPYHRMVIDALAAQIVWSVLGIVRTMTAPEMSARTIESVKEYLDQKYHEHGITLDTLSERLLISKDSIRHLFKRKYGVSPIRYLIGKKIDNAKALLSGTDKRIHEIAAETGFESEYYFSRVFKNATGSTPTAFRAASHRT
ncbi:MAG: AraC family transcriptional regulator [Spirochaetota bacterium]